MWLRRTVVGVVGAGLMCSVGLVGAASTAPSASAECLTAVADVEKAVQLAQACETDVEITSLRTEWDTVYAAAQGGTRVDTSIGAVRTRVNGSWESIDTTIEKGGSGRLDVVSPAMPISFSDGSPGQPLATIERDGHVLEFDSPFELTKPQIAGDEVTYPQVLPGVDLIVTVDPDGTGFSEVLRVGSPVAAANPALSKLEFPVAVSDGLVVSESEGGFVADDSAGEQVFTSPAPLMWDAGSQARALDAATGEHEGTSFSDAVVAADLLGIEVPRGAVGAPPVDSKVARMPLKVSANAVTVTPDAALLRDPDTEWPVYIDPSVSGTRHEWTAIRSTISSNYKFSDDEGLGLCDVSWVSSCGKDFVSRLVWEFHDVGGGVIKPLDHSDLISATFSAYGTHSWDCTEYKVNAFMVSNIGSGTTWSSNTGWNDIENNRQSGTYAAHKSSCPTSSTQPHRVEWDVMPAAKHLADEGGYLAIGLKAAKEGSMSRWKRYKYTAKLSILYNQAPKKPWNLAIAPSGGSDVSCGSNSWMRDPNPIMRANIGDPDGNKVFHNFNVKTSGGTMVYNGPKSGSSYADGSRVSRTVPSTNPLGTGSYKFEVQAKDDLSNDSNERWGPWATCAFNIDVTPPNQPTVAAVEGEPAVYEPDVETGGIGVSGKFAVGNNGSTDVKSFDYSWDDVENLGSTLDGSSGTIPYTPGAAGSHTLRIKAIDRAGNASPVLTYKIDVAAPREDAAWELDEGSGTIGEEFLGQADLEISGSASWVSGPFADYTSDTALQFSAVADSATTLGPVVQTDNSFVVGAHVRLDAFDNRAVAVSQDGAQSSGFMLGYAPDAGCSASSANGCWTFGVPDSDGGTIVEAESTFRVDADRWVYLLGAYDADKKQISLAVCDADPADPFTASGSRVTAQAEEAFTTPWFATGPLRLGRGMSGGSPDDPWVGAVDNVRVWSGQKLDADGTKLHRLCLGAPVVSSLPDEDPNDPTVDWVE